MEGKESTERKERTKATSDFVQFSIVRARS
jgi:hypothetical protein